MLRSLSPDSTVWALACGEKGEEKFLLQEQTSFALLNPAEKD